MTTKDNDDKIAKVVKSEDIIDTREKKYDYLKILKPLELLILENETFAKLKSFGYTYP